MDQPATPSPPEFEQLKESLKLYQLESFFDHEAADPRNQKSLWMSPNQVSNNEHKNTILIEGHMEKQGRTFSSWTIRHFILTEEFLAYKEKKGVKNLKRIMLLDRVRLQIVEPNESNKKRYGFTFTKNQKSASIFTSDKGLYEKFRNELEKRCILVTFNENYEIEKLIGRGSFGKVYLVQRKIDGKKFAAKAFLKEAVLKQTKGKQTLINEIKMLRKLDHPGIMQIYSVYETQTGLILIMELLEGGELFEHLKNKKTFTERDCAFVLIRIMTPLSYMHEKHIIHRDIKPENLILRSRKNEYDIVIADLGLAQNLNQPPIHVKCGSPGYCAPEILNSKGKKITYDAKCDVFSVGCVFYHMIVGKNPFCSKYPREALHFNKQNEVAFDDPKIKVLSSAAQNLLAGMLNRDPEKRLTFKQCLDHPFFDEVFQTPKSPVLRSKIRPPPPMMNLTATRLSERFIDTEYRLRSPHISSNLDIHDDSISFVFGRSNILKGKIDTLQELCTNQKSKEVKINLNALSENPTQPRSSSSALRNSGHAALAEELNSSSDNESANESSEIGRLASAGKPLEIALKVAKVKNSGTMNNPFYLGFNEKDVSSVCFKLIVSSPTKSLF